ncbi:hypothetical protein EVAR_89138_1 [Eumeta japonica]|uniref:Uncharacterized protein n=1 Tax=Eumeta variegata TaxID=151549 RepID=A0A4C1ZQP8_EUMVA|nr:hypothetical protein EVAR_89138_1 [Eumeta japonica]
MTFKERREPFLLLAKLRFRVRSILYANTRPQRTTFRSRRRTHVAPLGVAGRYASRPSGSNTDIALVTCRFVGGSDVSFSRRVPQAEIETRASLLMSHCRPRVFQFVCRPELYIVVISRVGHFIQDFNFVTRQPRNSKAAFR